MQRAQSESQKELQRLSDIALKREKELEEAINKLEESLGKSSTQVEDLVSRLVLSALLFDFEFTHMIPLFNLNFEGLVS